jgi:hypothetical protein
LSAHTLLKKVGDFPVHNRGVTNQTLPGRENNLSLGQGEFDF